MTQVKMTRVFRGFLYVIGVVIMCAIVLLAFTQLPKISVSNNTICYISLIFVWIFATKSSRLIEYVCKKLIMCIIFDETELSLKKNNIDCELELSYSEEDGIVVFENELNFVTQDTPDVTYIQEAIEKDLNPICDQIAKMFSVELVYTIFGPDDENEEYNPNQ